MNHRIHNALKSAVTLLTPLFGFASLHAEESAAGHYLPGTMGTLTDLAPTKPGWALESIYLHYEGETGKSTFLPVGGLLAAGLEATTDAALLGGFYTFDTKVAGAFYSVGAFVPYVWMDVTATLNTSFGSVSRNDTENGIGDITLIPLLMGWKKGDWQFDAALPIYAPTGDYEVGSLANAGLNRWTFDPNVGVSYNGAKNGFNAALHTGLSLNTENDDTDYKSGAAWHTEFSVQQLLPVGPGFVGIGANAFWYEQVEEDGGAGSRLGDFKGRTAGVGPTLSFLLPTKESNFVIEARWLPELETRNRLEGDYFWLKAVFQF